MRRFGDLSGSAGTSKTSEYGTRLENSTACTETYNREGHDIMVVTGVFLSQRRRSNPCQPSSSQYDGRTRSHLSTPPSLIPVPALDSAVIGRGQDDGQGRVDGDASDVILVRLPGVYTFSGRDRVHSGHKFV
jgi:hypothetical protein